MTTEELIRQFGYLAVFVGAFFEGETILVVASFFAARDYLSLPVVIGIGSIGAFLGHFFWFWLGRHHGTRLLARSPRLRRRLRRGLHLIERYGVASIFIAQYLYGLRITAAIIFGLTAITKRRFAFYQFLSCITWATLISLLGFFFGAVIQALLGRAKAVEKYGITIILLVALGVFVYHKVKGDREDEVVDEAIDQDDEAIRRSAELLEAETLRKIEGKDGE